MTKSAHSIVGHVLVTIGGTAGSGADQEIWQCGVKIGATNAPQNGLKIDNLQAYVNSYQAALLSWWSGSTGNMRSDYSLTFTKAANIAGGQVGPNQVGGLYDGSHDFSGGTNPGIKIFTPTAGFATTLTSSPLLTLAFTWRCSTNPRGRPGSVGRNYFPFNFGTVSLRAGAGSTALGVTSGKALAALLTKTAVAAGGGGTSNVGPCLFGWANSVGVVDQINVGDVVDVQRRRKSRLRDTYAVGTIP